MKHYIIKDAATYCKSFVSGKLLDFESSSMRKIGVQTPIDGKCIGYLNPCKQENIEMVVKNSREAFNKWKNSTPFERATILNKAATFFRENANKLAEYETLDTGKSIIQTSSDVIFAAKCLEFYASQCYNLKGTHRPVNDRSYVYTRREPLGVCLGIGAWNFPIINIVWKVAPAICTGNVMIFKPSELTPITSVIFAEILSNAGLPNGVLNVVQGDGDTGALFCAHKSIAKVSFTGGVSTGKKIAEMCSKTLKRLTIELGGKSPIVIFDDVKSIESAVNGVLMANFYAQGQICSNASRVYIQRNIYQEFKKALLKAVSKIKVGDPFDPSIHFGPLISSLHFKKVDGMIKTAIKEGAICLYGGDGHFIPSEELKDGCYLKPCILENCHYSMEIVKKEIFGPVITLLKFTDEDEVLAKANDTKYGLAAGVYTQDIGRATRFASAVDASTVYVNIYNSMPNTMNFGGRKLSGYGKENGEDALDCYTDVKSVYVETHETSFPL